MLKDRCCSAFGERPRIWVLSMCLALIASAFAGPAAWADVSRIDASSNVFDLTDSIEPYEGPPPTEPRIPVVAAGVNPGDDYQWLQVRLANDLGATTKMAVTIRQDSWRFGKLTAVSPHYAQIIQVFNSDGQFTSALPKVQSGVGEATYEFPLTSVGETTIIMAFTGDPRSIAVYAWNPESYQSYLGLVTLTHGILFGVLLVMAALLIAMWVFAETGFCLMGGVFSLIALVYLAFNFGYLSPVVPLPGPLELSLRDAMFALIGATGLALIISMLTFDPSDARLRRQLEFVLYGVGVAFLLVLFSVPFSLVIMRIALLVAIAAGAYAIPRQWRKGMHGVRLSVPGWLIIVLSYALAALVALLPLGERHLLLEPAVASLFVFGTVMIGFAIATQASARPFQTMSYRAPVRAPAPPPPMPRMADTREDPELTRIVHGLSAAKAALWDWRVKGDELYLSAYISDLLGTNSLPRSEQEWFERIHPDDRKIYRDSLASYLALGSVSFNLVSRLRTDSSDYVKLELRGQCIADDAGRPDRCIGVVMEVSDRTAEVVPLPAPTPTPVPTPSTTPETAEVDPDLDPLTQLLTRDAVFHRVDAALPKACGTVSESDDAAPPAMLLFDIDRFTSYNEGLGQASTDDLLIGIADRLLSAVSPDDIVGRVGGDEFAVFSPGGQGFPKAPELAELVQDLLGQPLEIAGQDIYVAASVGIAVSGDSEDTAQFLIEQAEKALYQAKKSGGGRVEVFVQGMGDDRGKDVALESDLRRALDRFEMEVYYQPIMDLKDGRIAGFESLIRWNHPERGLLMPEDFLALAERLNLIIRLDRFAMSMTSIQLSQWQQFFPKDIPLFASINLSTRQLDGDGLVNDIQDIMKSVPLAERSLKLEVTESSIIANEDEALRILNALKDLGAGLVLDDFGTGHSSLERLKKFPFDTIKIDQGFVVGLDEDSQSEIMVKSAIDLAHQLGMEVVAEGVETEEVGRRLYKMGCNFAQGYVFGPPMSAMDAQGFIANYLVDEPAVDEA